MSYEKQNFVDDQILTADHLNHIEDGIENLEQNKADKSELFSGDYNDLTNKPDIPSNTSQLTNDSGFMTSIPDEYVTNSELEQTLIPFGQELDKKSNILNYSDHTLNGTETYNNLENIISNESEAIYMVNKPINLFEGTTCSVEVKFSDNTNLLLQGEVVSVVLYEKKANCIQITSETAGSMVMVIDKARYTIKDGSVTPEHDDNVSTLIILHPNANNVISLTITKPTTFEINNNFFTDYQFVNDTEKENWNNKADKSEIPSIEGLATEVYVDNAMAELREEMVVLEEDDLTIDGLVDESFPSLTTEDKTLIGAINELNIKRIKAVDFDDIIYDDIENNTMVTHAPKIHMYVKEFGAVGDGVIDDTDAIQSALDNLNTIIEFEVGKTYKITRPLKMKYGVEIIGNKSSIITDVAFTEPLMLIGHSCEVSNLSFNLNDTINNNIIDVPILEINSEYIKSTYDEYDSNVWHASIFNIYLDNVRVYKWRRDDVCAGSALNIEATGKGVSGWGISVYNCNFLGHFDKAITIQTLQKYNDAEDVILPWVNDIKFNNCKINYSKLGFYVNSENLADNTNVDKIPKGPEAVNVYGCGMQAKYFTTYFAEIVSGNRIYFNDCEPWDWNMITDENARNNPYKIHTNETNYGITINRGNVINEGDLITSPVRKTKGEPVLDEANTLYNKLGSGDNGVFTFGDLYELIPGSYYIGEGQGNLLGLTDNLAYGGMLLVFNGFNGIKNFMVYAATIKDRECNIVTNVNTKVYTMCVPIRHLRKTDNIINTTITQNHWVKIMDETCIGVEGLNKPMVSDLNNIVEANNVKFIGALNTANGAPNNSHFNGISVGGNPAFHVNNALSWQLGADATQKNLVFRIKTSTAEDSWTEWGQLYGSKNMPAGSSTYRPTDVAVGSIYFDRTLNKPIWWNGVNWVDAAGANV